MKERPILFSAPMVRAILDGCKTQTRRVIKPPGRWRDTALSARCAVGDRLWVRETWADVRGMGITYPDDARPANVAYRADTRRGSDSDAVRKAYGVKWRPSIFMPRWASRLTLDVKAVRAERVQELSEEDAKAEGAKKRKTYARGFQSLWDSINAKRGYGWDQNPWVWVVDFKKMEGVT